MANISVPDNPQLNLQMEAMETTTPAHCDQWNGKHQQLLNNDKYLSKKIEETATSAGKKMDKTAVVDELDAVLAVTEDKVPVGSKAIQELNSNLSERINSGLSDFGRVTKILDHVTISTSSKQFTLGDLSKYKFLFFESSTTDHTIYLTSNLIPKEIYLMGKLISNIFFNDPSSYAQIRYQCVHTTKINVYIDVAEGFSELGFSVYGIE